MRSIVLGAIIFSTGAIIATACGKHDDAPAPAPAMHGVHGIDPGAPPPAAPDFDVCKLLTKDEAAKVLGHSVHDGVLGTSGTQPFCRYSADGATPATITLHYHADGNLDSTRKVVKDPVEIAGVGTKAYRNPDGTRLAVLANGHVGMLVVLAIEPTGSDGATGAPTIANTEDYARTLAGRL